MLRQACPEQSRRAQHERNISNAFTTKPVRPEPVEGRKRFFSPQIKKETYTKVSLHILWADNGLALVTMVKSRSFHEKGSMRA
jgi:hypothetical protein